MSSIIHLLSFQYQTSSFHIIWHIIFPELVRVDIGQFCNCTSERQKITAKSSCYDKNPFNIPSPFCMLALGKAGRLLMCLQIMLQCNLDYPDLVYLDPRLSRLARDQKIHYHTCTEGMASVLLWVWSQIEWWAMDSAYLPWAKLTY